MMRTVRSLLIVLKNATRDLGPFIKTRQGFAEDMRIARRSIISDDEFGHVSAIVAVGGGHLENAYYLATDLGAKKIFAFDPVAKPARYIEKNIDVHFYNEKLENIREEEKANLSLEENFVWEISNTLQTMLMAGKEGLLNKIWELSKPGQLVVLVDEEVSDSSEDTNLNLLYNPEQEVFDRLTSEQYEELFHRTGFRIVKKKRHYHRDLDITILEVLKTASNS